MSEAILKAYYMLGNQFDEDPRTCQKLYPPKVFPFSFETSEQVLLRDIFQNACGFYFFEIGDLKKEFPFQAKGQFTVFAHDNQNGYYGFIGGIGGLEEEDVFSIGYVGAAKQAGKVSDSFMELLCLILHYPNWYDIITNKADAPQYGCDIAELGQQIEQCEQVLGITPSDNALELLKARLQSEPPFQVFYPSEKIL